MNRWKLILGVVLIFLFGALAGSIGTGYYLKRFSSSNAGIKYEKTALFERFSRELNLTADQKNQIGKILDRLDEKRREHVQGITSEVRLAVVQIKKELRPDQQMKFDRLREEFKKGKKSRE